MNIADPDPMLAIKDADPDDRAVCMVLDSGAYSAKTQGAQIDIDEYIAYIKYNMSSLYAYAALDVIGNAEASYDNLKYMESKGLNPWPVFHYREPFHYLEEYVANYEYIALGGMVGEIKSLTDWLDFVWSEHLTDDKGFATTKVHGFGLSSVPALIRYPWESADSTSWVLVGSFGKVLVPASTNGKADFLKIPNRITVSTRDDDKKLDPDHLDNLPASAQQVVMDYLHSLDGDLAELKVDYRARDAINIHWFQEMEKALNAKPRSFIPRAKGFFR